MTGGDNRFLLVYGTETGQSKAISEEIAERCEQISIHADIHCFGKIEKEFIIENEELIVIVTSTTGDGEPPETVGKFWRRIKRRTVPKDHFSRLQYALLGLGDSNYNNFCNCAKMMDKRLQEVGATYFMEPGFADDATGLELVVEPWIDQLLAKLCQRFGLSPPAQEHESVSSLTDPSTIETPYIDLPTEVPPTIDMPTTVIPVIDTPSINTTTIDASIMDKPVSVEPVAVDTPNVDSLAKNTKNLSIAQSDQNMDTVPGEVDNKITQPFNRGRDLVDTTCDSTIAGDWTSNLPAVTPDQLTLPSSPAAYIELQYITDSQSQNTEKPALIQNGCTLPFADSPVFTCPVKNIRSLTSAGSVKTTLEIQLNTQKVVGIKSGDSVGIVAENDSREVNWLLDRIGVEDSTKLIHLSIRSDTSKKRASIPDYITNPSTIQDIFTTCLDLRFVPKKAVLRLLASYCKDELDKSRLLLLSSRQGAKLYTEHITGKRRGLIHILHDFPSCKPSLVSVLENLPRLLPRPYSSASSSESDSLRFAFNVVHLPDIGEITERRGLVTGRLFSLYQTDSPNMSSMEVRLYRRTHQTFRLPENMSTPLILIGPGTGVAPYIGFLEDRMKFMEHNEDLSECHLFFGNRNKDKDFLYKEELERHLSAGTLTQLHACFSRDGQPEESGSSHYVTDLMRQQSKTLCRLVIQDGACIYVCGDAKNMAKDVLSTFTEVFMSGKGLTIDEASELIKDLRITKRYKEDVWT